MTVRTTEDVAVFCALDPLGAATGHYKMFLRVGARTHVAPRRVTIGQLRYLEERSRQEPVAYLRVAKRRYWRFGETWVLAHESATSADVLDFLTIDDAEPAIPAPRRAAVELLSA